MPIKVQLIGAGALEKAGQLSRKNRETLMLNLHRAARTFGLFAVYKSKTDYLSGPRPEKLGVVTGRLRSSIVTETTTEGDVISTKVGSNVRYAAIQELGGTIEATPSMYGFFWAKFKNTKDEKWKWMALGLKKKGQFVIPARPFLRPAIDDAMPSFKNNIRLVLSRMSLTGETPEFQA